MKQIGVGGGVCRQLWVIGQRDVEAKQVTQGKDAKLMGHQPQMLLFLS